MVLPIVFLVGLNSAALNYQLTSYPLTQLLHAPGTDALLFINAALAIGSYLLRLCVLKPWRRLVHTVERAAHELAPDSILLRTPASMSAMANEVIRLTSIARENHTRCRELASELAAARETINRYTHANHTLIGSTNREVHSQYQNVLAYAHYLEERISNRAVADEVRQDFDDVLESSLNLKLIASALALLNHAPVMSSVAVADTMKHMMLALAPSLERRTMRLSSAEVDLSVKAHTDPGILSHTLWMMLLGIVRYAENESTLRLRSLYDHDKKQAMVSIVVSELAPGKLSADERGKYLERQMQSMQPHMFADTVRLHANLQLAQLLLSHGGGRIEVVPLNAHACEICLFLPAA